ncbi:MAG: RNA polymerase sigma factor [Oscillospiraceae bacterium]
MKLFGETSTEQLSTLAQTTIELYLSEIAAGEKSALSALYEETRIAVYGFALSIVKNVCDAEDVLQETYVKIWLSAAGYSARGKPMAWILTITKNLAKSMLRERGKTADIPEDDWQMFYAPSKGASSEDRIVLQAALGALKDEERQIITLHAVSGLKHVEIAQLLELPLSTVLSKYSRARKKLQAALEEGDFK